jgi:aryl-alcohol dehydrogenase-like predicted oxidoreductase
MGRCIQRLAVDRSELVISTKVLVLAFIINCVQIFWGGKGVNQSGLSRKHIIEGTKASLKRLQLEYVDLIFCHRPDITTPIEETVRAMNYVINQGWALYWGTSEWTATQLMQAHQIANRLGLIGPLMEQPQYSMLHRSKVESEYLPLYREFKLGTTVSFPYAVNR